jgi:hypothetical protein
MTVMRAMKRLVIAGKMMLVSIEPERQGVDLDTFQCAVCNHVLTALAAHEDPLHSKALGRWLQGDLHPTR